MNQFRTRIILVRGQNFASGGQIFTMGQNFASGGQNFATGGQNFVTGGQILLVWGQIRNLKKIKFFSKNLFFKFNYFSPFFLIIFQNIGTC
jgi:hypothetical protein